MQMSTSTDHVVFIIVDFGNEKENEFLLLFLLHITLFMYDLYIIGVVFIAYHSGLYGLADLLIYFN